MNNENRISLIAAFIGIALTAFTFKTELQNIYIDFLFNKIDLFLLIANILVLLLISLWLYSLDNIKYIFKKIDTFPFQNKLNILADIFYVFAILSPLMISIIWIFMHAIKYFIFLIAPLYTHIDKLLEIVAAFTIIFLSFLAGKATTILSKNKIIRKEEILDKNATILLLESKKLFQQKFYGPSILSAFQSLEYSIEKKLTDLNLDLKKIPFIEAINILFRHEIISREDVNQISIIRSIRNKAAHSNEKFKLEDAKNTLHIVEMIIPKLETKTTSSRLYENIILDALINTNKFLTKHHIISPYRLNNIQYDALIDGPKYRYLVEIKNKSDIPTLNKSMFNLIESLNDKTRGIIIVPYEDRIQQWSATNIKVLYYDKKTNSFLNYSDIHDWMYKE